MTRFAKFALSGLTALSLSLTPVPAAADSEDIGKIIAGLAVLGVVAAAANDRKKRRERERAARATQADPFKTIEGRNGVVNGTIRRADNNARYSNRAERFSPIPARCARILTTNRGERRVYGQRCLNRHYDYAFRLPQKCNIRVRTNSGTRSVYGARCLRRNGWQLAQY